MQIGVDGNEANVSKRVGVSVYTYELLKYFKGKADKNCLFTVYLKKSPIDDMPQKSKFFKYSVVKSPLLYRDIFLPAQIAISGRPDVFFSPAHYAPRFCPAPFVVTIHDLAYEYYPQDFLKKDLYKLKNWTRHAVRQAKKIIAVSKNTKKDLVKVYKVPEDKIEVIYNGYRQTQIANAKSQNHNLKLEALNHFILYVGTLQPRKNIETLICAFEILHKEMKNYNLIIAGRKGWMYKNIYKKVRSLSIEKNVVFTDYVDDKTLKYLYQNASVFVMPSFYEGFGIPVLEAMDNKCPVVSADSSSLPEIAGDAAMYFNPHDKIELYNNIKKVLTNRRLRDDMIKKGKERVKKFSWDQCAEKTFLLLKKTTGYER